MTHSSDLVRIVSQEVQPLGVVPRCGLRCRHSLPGHLGERAGHVLNKAAVDYRRAAAQPVGAAAGGAGKPPVQKTRPASPPRPWGCRDGHRLGGFRKRRPATDDEDHGRAAVLASGEANEGLPQLVGLTMLVLVAV